MGAGPLRPQLFVALHACVGLLCVLCCSMVDRVMLRARVASWLSCTWVGVVSAGGRCGCVAWDMS